MIGSLFFILWLLSLFICLVAAMVSLLRRRGLSAMRLAKTLNIIFLGYLFILVVVSLATPRRIIETGETWRFDHWGVAVESVELLPSPLPGADTQRIAVNWSG